MRSFLNLPLKELISKNHNFIKKFSSKKFDNYWNDISKLPENFKRNFMRESIPFKSFQTKFVTSSGPGGQNVNKVATKVELRFNLEKSITWLPNYIISKFKSGEVITSGKINKDQEYVISSSRTRSQISNLEDCIDKIYDDILKIADTVPKPTSQEAVKRIAKLQSIEKERKRKDKGFRAAKKADRRKREFDD